MMMTCTYDEAHAAYIHTCAYPCILWCIYFMSMYGFQDANTIVDPYHSAWQVAKNEFSSYIAIV